MPFASSTFGELKTVRLPKKMAGTGAHRGFGFVDFLTKQDAKVSEVQAPPLWALKAGEGCVRRLPKPHQRPGVNRAGTWWPELSDSGRKAGGGSGRSPSQHAASCLVLSPQRAFNALCHSTHLYGRRLVLEWADSEVSLQALRRKTAEHFH
ncbi:putative RNA-binding protein 19, partial [Galemys pyrenaicus]